MASQNTFVKTFIIYIAISLFIYFANIPQIDASTNIVGSLIDVDNATYSQELVDAQPDVTTATGTSGILTFIDSLNAIGRFITLVVGVILAIPSLFIGTNMPFAIQLLLGVPLGIISFLGIMLLARGLP